jgi:hypothetical protein
MRTKGRLATGALAAAAMLVQGCGGTSGPRTVLSDATSRIGDIRAGNLSIRFALAPNTDAARNTVGILIHGSFALDRRHRLPVLHVAYTRYAGTKSTTVNIDSNGQTATVGAAGRQVPLNGQQQQILAGTLQGPQGLGNLPVHLDRWVQNPVQTRGPNLGGQATDQITGTVNLANTLADLNQLSGGQVNQATRAPARSKGLAKTLRSSSVLAVVGHNDHLLRRLALRVKLAPATSTATNGLSSQGLKIALDITLAPQPLAR